MVDWEYQLVERPLFEQLKGMGWEHLQGAPPESVTPLNPFDSGRAGFDEVFLEDRLRDALYRINLGPDGQPWLDYDRIDQAVNELKRIPASGNLIEANQTATKLLLEGTVVDGVVGWEGGKSRPIHYIDWQNPENNLFTVVNQFRVDVPGNDGHPIIPDVVLFVNGIPLVVLEAKKPQTSSLINAVGQLLRYSEQTKGEVRLGNQRLFHTVQLTAVSSGEDAKLGTITSRYEHYVPWRDPYPMTREDLGDRFDKPADAVSRQEILAAVLFDKARLLDIVHNYVTFMVTDDGKTIKAAPRYQQFRAVDRAVRRLRTGETKQQDGERDRRGGIVWHTQGSGKSLTMTFLVRKLRASDDLKHFKVVVVTDRTQLQDQLSKTMELSNEKTDVAKSGARARTLLGKHGPGLVFVMIQKHGDGGGSGPGMSADTSLGEVTADDSIVVLVDEAHRSHTASLGTNLQVALPNAARIGFTGTPIMTKKGRRKTSLELFGEFIDMYRLKDAEEDGVIVPILYEGLKVRGAVQDGRDLDEVVDEMFEELDSKDRDQLQRRYATKSKVSAAERLIAAKAKHMLRHYVQRVLPEGFKAQVVALDRVTTVQYREALMAARDELVAEVEALPGRVLEKPLDELKPRQAYLVGAHHHLDLLKRMEFVPVISEGDTDHEAELADWTNKAKQNTRVDDFLKPFDESNVGFVIVNAMLLTGFDAPIEQVMYLDRRLKEHDLLQAVARVNRTADGKEYGYVVDYQGVAQNLVEALKIYAHQSFDEDDMADVEQALKDVKAEMAKLEPRCNRVRMMFRDPDDVESCVEELADTELRDRFNADFALFAKTYNAVLPDPAVKPFEADLKRFTVVKITASRRYRVDDGEFDPAAYGGRIKHLIDEHVTSLGIEQMLPPVALTAPDFTEKVEALPGGSRAKASEMEHAIRHHITVNKAKDPAYYQRLSERLEEILQQLKDDWTQQILALEGLITELREDAPENPHNLSPVEGALYGVLAQEIATSDDDPRIPDCVDAAQDVYHRAAEVIHRKDFWHSSKETDREEFRSEICGILFGRRLATAQDVEKLAGRLFEVIKANRERIPRS
ncbi:type I restriction endonuclease subunit R [Actinomadura chokoriensis]|uniref:type I restriction endonuclease subunit R n=1 Tax=Actinomadura chokoriensis TaxID=454156 RepID=UPI0031FA2BDA